MSTFVKMQPFVEFDGLGHCVCELQAMVLVYMVNAQLGFFCTTRQCYFFMFETCYVGM